MEQRACRRWKSLFRSDDHYLARGREIRRASRHPACRAGARGVDAGNGEVQWSSGPAVAGSLCSDLMTIASPEGAKFAARLGIQRVVLAREASMREMAKFNGAAGLPSLEVFVQI